MKNKILYLFMHLKVCFRVSISENISNHLYIYTYIDIFINLLKLIHSNI